MTPNLAEFLPPWRRRSKYAALSHLTTPGNLGDEIQAIAASRFLPRVDAWVDRERLDEFRSTVPHKIILNGWFLHRPEHWPPSRHLHPLIVSFHLTREMHPAYNERMLDPRSTVLGPKGIDYLRSLEPIGARDLDTLDQLRSAGIEAYFSGCLTLTLRMRSPVIRGERVYAVDVPDDVLAHLRREYDLPIIRLTHVDSRIVGRARWDAAKSLLHMYASAKSVLTSRLHCALPCLALGTPVLFIEAAPDTYRFDGLRDLLHRVSAMELLDGCCDYDLEGPPENGDEWRSFSDRLREHCEAFVSDG